MKIQIKQQTETIQQNPVDTLVTSEETRSTVLKLRTIQNESTEFDNKLWLTFDYQTLPIRTITDGDAVWFVLKDICEILSIKHPRYVWNRLDDDERGVGKIYTPGGLQEMQIINEPGLYDVIIRSNSEKAKPFRRWITHDVLPTIRKQGFYSLMPDEQLVSLLNARLKSNPDLVRDVTLDKRNEQWLSNFQMDEELRKLWEKRTEISKDEYLSELARICNHSISRYNKEWSAYVKWHRYYKTSQAESGLL